MLQSKELGKAVLKCHFEEHLLDTIFGMKYYLEHFKW